jgi:Family of unknown function (DUF6512)
MVIRPVKGMIRNRKTLIIEIIGVLFIIFIGTALHFTFALSGNNPIVGAFSAVNESVWEHLKLPFWSSIFWLLISFYPLRKTVSNLFLVKTIGILLMIVIIPAVFYSYTAFTEEILVVDIATFIIAVIIGQLVSYKLYKQTNESKLTEATAIVIITLLATLFVIFTFYPPHLPIFLDSNTCKYGI